MDNQTQLQQVLERMERNSRKQLFYSRVQCVFCIVAALCCMVLLAKLLQFMPQLELLAAQMELVLTNLEAITTELEKLDMTAMVDNINTLVATSQSGVEKALSKINEIDINTLNQAVKDLAAVVQPLADFIKKITLGGLL